MNDNLEEIELIPVDVSRIANASQRLCSFSALFLVLGVEFLILYVSLSPTGINALPLLAWVCLAGLGATTFAWRFRFDRVVFSLFAVEVFLAAAVCAFFVGICLFTSDDEPTPLVERLGLGLLCLVPACGFGWLLWNIVRLIRAPAMALNLSPMEIADDFRKKIAVMRRRKWLLHTPTNPIRASFYGCIWLVWSLTFAIYFSWLVVTALEGHSHIHGGLPQIPIAISIGLFMLFRRHYAMRAGVLLKRDTREPVLFLRSFVDDKVKLHPYGILRTLRRRNIEQAIAPFAEYIGPFVAIANPGKHLPLLGAAKQFYSGDTWQDAIERWVLGSRLVVMVAGRTDWVKWELERIMSLGATNRLIVLIPRDRVLHPGERAQWLDHYFAHTPYAPAIKRLSTEKLLALTFCDDKLFAIYHSRLWKREMDYVVAFNTAVYISISQAQKGSVAHPQSGAI